MKSRQQLRREIRDRCNEVAKHGKCLSRKERRKAAREAAKRTVECAGGIAAVQRIEELKRKMREIGQ